MLTMPSAPVPAEVVIGLDVGTTATKVAVFGLRSPFRLVVVRDYPLLQPQAGRHVQDPSTVLNAVMDALSEAVRQAEDAKVAGISVSAAMHGLIGLDAQLRPLTPLVTWADSRATEEAAELRASDEAEALHLTSGTPLHPMSPLTKLVWFDRHEPELAQRVRAWVGLKDLVLHALTGTLATELSSASGTGMLDLSTGGWNPRALEIARIRADQLPPVLSTTDVLGLAEPVAVRLGLPTGTAVVVGAGDGPLGNVGTGALEDGVVGLSLGTSGAARMVVPRPATDPTGRQFCYALADGAWVIGGAVSNGGIAMEWAKGVFARASGDPGLLELAASVAAGSDGLRMVPYLLAERAPMWDPTLAGAFLGLRSAHTRGHLARSVIEGVALQLWTVVDQLDGVVAISEVRGTGGVFGSHVWREVLAGVLGHPLRVTGDAEGSALGAAALGLTALGRSESLVEAVHALSPGLVAGRGAHVPVDPGDEAVYSEVRSTYRRVLRAYAELNALVTAQTHPDL